MTGQADERARQRCRRRSVAVQAFAICLLSAEAVFVLLLAVSQPAPDDMPARALLGLIWLLAASLYAANLALVSTGPQQLRIAHAPLFVNRPGFIIRLTFHVIINWSAIAVTLLWAAVLDDQQPAAQVARICGVAIVLLWIAFNVMHRRFNRARNLLLSSVPAAALLLAAVLLIRLAEAAMAE